MKENILATLAYYDILDFPLKAEEIFKFLINFSHLSGYQRDDRQLTFEEVKKELGSLTEGGTIGFGDGFYFLFDRAYLVPLRLKKEKIAGEKWRKTLRAFRWAGFLPYLRIVFASGSLANRNTDELSDLDVLVAAKHGRIWLARLFLTGLFSIMGARRKPSEKIAPDKICLNHYITDKSLSIAFKSIYNAQTYANLIPVLAAGESLLKDFQKQNSWVLDYVCSWPEFAKPKLKRGFLGKISTFLEFLLDNAVGDWLECLAGRYQMRRIKNNPRTYEPGGRVVFNDEQLEFHPQSFEKKVIEEYNRRLAKIGLGELAVEKDSGLKI